MQRNMNLKIPVHRFLGVFIQEGRQVSQCYGLCPSSICFLDGILEEEVKERKEQGKEQLCLTAVLAKGGRH